LVPDVDDQRGHADVEHERNHEDLGVKDPFEVSTQPTEHRVQRSHHRDRQIGLDDLRDGGVKDQAQHDAHRKRRDTDHARFPVRFSLRGVRLTSFVT